MNVLHRLAGWFRDRSLRSRLAILTAAAVAVTIALAATASWFLVRDRLLAQAQDRLTATSGLLPRGSYTLYCSTSPSAALSTEQTGEAGHATPHFLRFDTQLLGEDGTTCFLPGAQKIIETSHSDRSVLSTGQTSYREGHYTDGTPAMIRRSVIQVPGFGQPSKPYVLLAAESLTSVDDSLRSLALILGGVAVLGVVAAGGTGRLVARSALRPVDQLSDAVEHIARTEELGTTIPVHGNDEIARLSSSFNSMSTALANSRERQTRLIADAGHELRTPLTSLRTNVDLLIRSDRTGRPLPPETRAKLLGNMKAQMQELTVLIGDLLELSRPDSPKPGQNLTVVALHEIAARAIDRARLRGPGLAFDVSVDPWYVHGDPADLERAVINLLDNAVKYSPPSGTVAVDLHHGTLTVRDHGPGIPPDELPYVFDRFWRSPSSRQLPGSGLGLSIVAQTVSDTGGRVSLAPPPDGGPGALATLQLPGGPNPPE